MSGSHWVATFVKEWENQLFRQFWVATISRNCESCREKESHSDSSK